MKVLIVVDMQNDFVDGVLGSKEAVSMIDTAVETITSFDGKVFYTQDTHGEDYLDTEEGRHLPVVHCIKGSQGWKIHPKIEKALLLKDATGIEKSTFGSEKLMGIIEKEVPDVESITLIGICTDICVISNAMLAKAHFQNTPVTVISSACAGVTPESHENALAAMKMCHIEIQ
ncbi:isochorismatase family cysteine hydrolase [uncultured Granulicatella sp.]|uniref:cysteine hydrolase family protein n=1 Tax=uncultured Granulicatella sp. TaxID=316089 RepID=UPI0026108601|nr:isochorismatase family cysteine hydrolase [uncultured Granulicatella sp.]